VRKPASSDRRTWGHTTVDFEQYPAGTVVTHQYANVGGTGPSPRSFALNLVVTPACPRVESPHVTLLDPWQVIGNYSPEPLSNAQGESGLSVVARLFSAG
jgi:hypothetical protein